MESSESESPGDSGTSRYPSPIGNNRRFNGISVRFWGFTKPASRAAWQTAVSGGMLKPSISLHGGFGKGRVLGLHNRICAQNHVLLAGVLADCALDESRLAILSFVLGL